MKGSLGDKQRLEHILDAIVEINSYTSSSDLPSFLSNSMMRYATIKQIEIIGEAANLISDITRQEFQEIEWKQIIGLRHVLVHEYFGIDSKLVWQIVVNDIPLLKERIQKILASLE
jgi:uncharacterized protein with HEPN domain